MATESISDILQGLARQRGRGDANPLVLWRTLEGTPGSRAGHVPISQQISQAWVRLTGDPFRPHQAAALAKLRRGEPVALRGASPAGGVTARLLLFELLQAERDASALLLLPDTDALLAQRDLLAPMNAVLGNPFPLALVDHESHAVSDARARILLATPATLHERLLHYHERAWLPFWQRLRAIWVDEAHTYVGVAGAHLSSLLLRCARLRLPGVPPPRLLATLADVGGAEDALAALGGQPWRVVPVDDVPTQATALAVWRGGSECLREAAALAQALHRAGYSVHLSCAPLDLLALRQLVGEEAAGLSVGVRGGEAQVHVVVGYPGSHAMLRQAVHSGAQATVLVLSSQLCEQTLARLPNGLLDDPPPVWTLSPANAYVVAQHLQCAANEQPLVQAEVDAWQADELISRMERQGQLVQLPGSPASWQPRSPAAGTAPANDPYGRFGLFSAGGLLTELHDERGQTLGTFDTPLFDRWGFVGATLPPGSSRYRVVGRDEEQGRLVLRPEIGGRRTYPLRRCQISVRDEREKRPLRGGRTLAWGRVLVEEEVYGYREAQSGGTTAERSVTPALSSRWATHAVWVDVGITPPVGGQLVGWSLAAALPLRLLARFTDIVPAYNEAERRLYFVDAHPGGSGLATWMFGHLEELLPLAYDIALDCRSDALLEPLARADMDWLLLLLGGDSRRAEQRETPPPQRVEVPAYPAETAREDVPPSRTSAPLADDLLPPVSPIASARTSDHTDSVPSRPSIHPIDEVLPPVPLPTPPAETPVADNQAPAHMPAPLIDDLLPPVLPPPQHAGTTARDDRSRPVRPGRQERQDSALGDSKKASGRRGRQNAPHARPPSASQPPSTEKNDRRPEPRAAQTPQPPTPPTHNARRGRAVPSPQQPSDAARAGEHRPPSAAPAAQTPAPPPEPTIPSAGAMIARMRELRQQRERQMPTSPAPRTTRAPLAGEARFKAGDSVLCVPYGTGIVRESRIEDDQEILAIDFPDFGELTIDPAVSLVRMVEAANEEEEE